MTDQASAGRAVDESRVAIREVQFTAAQERLAESMYRGASLMCATPEEATALIVFALSEFINKVSKPELIPEAVETAVRCLRFNCGVPQPVNLDGHSINCQCNLCMAVTAPPADG